MLTATEPGEAHAGTTWSTYWLNLLRYRFPPPGGRPLKQLWTATAASQLFTWSQQWRLTIEGAQLMSKAGEQICTGRILLLDKLEIEV